MYIYWWDLELGPTIVRPFSLDSCMVGDKPRLPYWVAPTRGVHGLGPMAIRNIYDYILSLDGMGMAAYLARYDTEQSLR